MFFGRELKLGAFGVSFAFGPANMFRASFPFSRFCILFGRHVSGLECGSISSSYKIPCLEKFLGKRDDRRSGKLRDSFFGD